MARSRALSLRPVRSVKHIIETNGLISAAVASTTDVVSVDQNPTIETNPGEVNIGATVSSIYLRVEVIGVLAAAGVDNIYMIVYKNPGGSLIAPAIDTLGGSDRRKFVMHQEMTMLTPFEATGTTGFPRTLFKGVVRIPPRYRRFGVQDKLQVIIQHRSGETTQTTRFCVECIYKEFM